MAGTHATVGDANAGNLSQQCHPRLLPKSSYGVYTPYTDRRNGAIFTLDWRLAVGKKGMPAKPAGSGMTA